MPVLLFVAFVVVPLVELFVIVQVAEVISLGPTILLLIADSLLGAWLVRREGRRAWTALREAFAAGSWPADEVTQGGLVIFGGALLLTPGFVTDVLGLACVIPPTRALMSAALRRWTSRYAASRLGGGSTSSSWIGGRTRPGGRRNGPPGPGKRARRPVTRPSGDDDGAPGDERRVPDVEVLGVERDEPSG